MKRLFALLLLVAIGIAPLSAQKKEVYKVRTLVIDPGHGGAKPGARGSRSMEKDITLAVALKFGKLVADNYPDVKIIYTRTTDVDISLAERAHIANQNKADLFISIHANSHPTASPTGVETFVMGLSESNANLEVAKKENADILLEADYKNNEAYKDFDPNSAESYVMLAMFQNEYINKSLNLAQLIQQQYRKNIKTINRGVKQAELFVLYKTAMPSVLTEVGFISNPTEESFMLSDEGQAKIALSLFNAFMSYKAAEEGSARIANPVLNIPGLTPAPAKQEAVAQKPAAVFQEEVIEVVPTQPKAEEQPATAVAEQPKPAEEKPATEVAMQPKPAEEQPTTAVAMKPKPAEEQPATAVAEQPKPAEEKPATAVAEQPASPQPLTKPVPTARLAERDNTPTPQPAPSPKPAPKPKVPLNNPTNTASGNPFYTVQFLTSNRLLHAGDPELENVKVFEHFIKNGVYCYITGRFATFAEASTYCLHLREATSFADAWVTLRKEAAAPQQPQATTPQPKSSSQQPAGIVYRIQFCTSPKQMKAGDPDLHGVSDIRSSKSGRFYLYTTGNFSSRAEADKRCAEIHRTTPFKDAFVVGFKNGERINID